MDVFKGLTWFTKDSKFINKLLILSGLALSCILILPVFFVAPFFLGYLIDTIRSVQDSEYELPELKYMEQFKKGVFYMIFVIIFFVVFGVIEFIIEKITGGLLYKTVRTSYTNSSYSFSANYTVIGFVWNILKSILVIYAQVIYAKTNTFASLFNLGNYRVMVQNNGVKPILIQFIFPFVAMPVLLVGALALVVGMVPAAIVCSFMYAGLFGQLKTDGVKGLVVAFAV